MALLRLFLPAIVTCIMLAVLVALGIWQLERLAWKRDLLTRIEARHTAPSKDIVAMSDLGALSRADDDYRRAVIYGRFAPETAFWFTQIENRPQSLAPHDGVGYHALSPFVLADGAALLVDRGFVPARLKDSLPPPPTGAQRLSVILRWPDRRRWFDNADKPQDDLFFVRDPKAIGAHWQMRFAPMIGERVDFGRGWPRGGQTRMALANNHLQYAGTWFGLAIVLVIVSGLWHIRLWNTVKAKDARW